MAWKLRPPLCMLCSHGFAQSSGKVVVCGHREGAVHEGCCRDNCSLDRQGHLNCPHARAALETRELVAFAHR